MPEKKKQKNLSLTKQIVFSLIIVSCLIGLAEVSIRIWAYYFRTSYERYNPDTGRLELIPNIRYTENGNEFWINSKGFVGPEFDEQPAEGVYRIISVGDSCTFGAGFWKLTYPAIVESLLNEQNRENRKFEVLNAGIEGYNSTFALERIKQEIIPYHPNLVTIYIGWNDLMKVDPENLSATGKYTFLAEWLEKSYLVKAYKKLLFIYLRPLLFKPKLIADEAEAHAYDDFVPTMYQENLEAMIQELRKHGIQVMLFTLPTVVRPLMTQAELKRQNVFFPYFAGTYSVDKFLSLHRAYNNVIREVGVKYNVPVVDLDRIFNQHDKDKLFWDTMHPSRKGHQLIAEAVSKAILEEMQLGRLSQKK